MLTALRTQPRACLAALGPAACDLAPGPELAHAASTAASAPLLPPRAPAAPAAAAGASRVWVRAGAAAAAHSQTPPTGTSAGSFAASGAAPWYSVREEEELTPPSGTGDEDSFLEAPLVSRHPSQKFAAVLSTLRAHFPESVWERITALFPDRPVAGPGPVAVDIAVGAEGRGGVELARRGFHVTGVEGSTQLLARTFQFAQAHAATIELITAKVEHSLLGDGAADLVTFLHGLHLVDTEAALREAWRLLRPGGRLVAAWNDRDLSSPFVRELEDVLERRVPSYNRYQKQRAVEEWAGRLQEGGLFKLQEYSCHRNPVPMPSASALLDVLDCMSFVRASLRGEARKRFNNDVRLLLERRFGRRAFALPLESRLYILQKIHSEDAQASGGGGGGGGQRSHDHDHHTIFTSPTPAA